MKSSSFESTKSTDASESSTDQEKYLRRYISNVVTYYKNNTEIEGELKLSYIIQVLYGAINSKESSLISFFSKIRSLEKGECLDFARKFTDHAEDASAINVNRAVSNISEICHRSSKEIETTITVANRIMQETIKAQFPDSLHLIRFYLERQVSKMSKDGSTFSRIDPVEIPTPAAEVAHGSGGAARSDGRSSATVGSIGHGSGRGGRR